MTIAKLQRTFEERRINLIDTLQKNKESLEISKQHQLYGAIKELETVLKTIDYYREEQLSGEDFELKREGPPAFSTRIGLAFRAMGERTKGAVSRVGAVFNETVVKGTKNAVKTTKHRIRFVKEVAAEVKARSKTHEKEE